MSDTKENAVQWNIINVPESLDMKIRMILLKKRESKEKRKKLYEYVIQAVEEKLARDNKIEEESANDSN